MATATPVNDPNETLRNRLDSLESSHQQVSTIAAEAMDSNRKLAVALTKSIEVIIKLNPCLTVIDELIATLHGTIDMADDRMH